MQAIRETAPSPDADARTRSRQSSGHSSKRAPIVPVVDTGFLLAGYDHSDTRCAAIIRGAYRIITECGWSRGSPARDRRGDQVHAFAPQAASFTMGAALVRAARDLNAPQSSVFNLHKLTRETLGVMTVSDWEDRRGRTQDDVEEMLLRLLWIARRDGLE